MQGQMVVNIPNQQHCHYHSLPSCCCPQRLSPLNSNPILEVCSFAIISHISTPRPTLLCVRTRRQREDMTLDVLRYTGAPVEHRQRVQTYFQYITQYSHPTTEGMTIMSDLPKALYQEVAGGCEHV